jgi:hypothetical protein
LKRFDTSYDSGTGVISIKIPDLALHIRSAGIQRKGPGETVRMKLEFPVTAFSTYEIRYQRDLSSSSSPVAFSLTAAGPANQTTVSTFSDQVLTVYVDATGPVGFFVVGLVLNQIPQ